MINDLVGFTYYYSVLKQYEKIYIFIDNCVGIGHVGMC